MNHDVFHYALAGGLFAFLVFWHFVSDWLFQSHDEAMKKPKDHQVRANHCYVYTLFFAPVMGLLGLSIFEAALCGAILFFSHFIEDTYYPVLLWAKHVRKPPEFSMTIEEDGVVRLLTDEEAFIKWVTTPLGKIIMIVVDQLVHIAFLIPITYFAIT